MKNLANLLTVLTLLLLTMIAVPQNANSQDPCTFDYLSIGEGRSPVANGPKFTAKGSCGDNPIIASFGLINGYFIYQWSDVFGIDGLSVGPSGGIFQEVPWIAPIVSYSPHEAIEFMAWIGPSLGGNAAVGEFEFGDIQMAFTQFDVKLNFTDNIYAGFSYLEFGGKSYLPYGGVSVPLPGDTMELAGSVTLPVEDGTISDPMIFVEFRWKPKFLR